MFLIKKEVTVVIEQTRLLGTVFLCSEFKLENLYSGVNFCGKNVCGNFYFGGTYFCGSLEKPQKLEQNLQKFRATRYPTKSLLLELYKELIL